MKTKRSLTDSKILLEVYGTYKKMFGNELIKSEHLDNLIIYTYNSLSYDYDNYDLLTVNICEAINNYN